MHLTHEVHEISTMANASITRQSNRDAIKEEDKWVQYHDGQKQFKVPFIMYADSESILEPMEKNSKGQLPNMEDVDLVYTANLHMEMFLIH